MRTLKKICSAVCAAAIALGSAGNVTAAQNSDSQIKYNYKLSLESESEFSMVYGYNGGTMSTKKSFVAGKYGNALQITYPGHVISNASKRYNGFVMQFKKEPIKLANESISMLDLMRDTKNISMWVHTPQTVDHGNGAAEHRILELSWEYSTTEGNKKYSKKFQLPNRGQWEYITLPTSVFKAGSVSMDEAIQSDIYTALTQMTVIFPYKDYFGANPTPDTLDAPWEEPLIIDEMLFDRSTDEVKAITPPSTGEEEYFENANISEVFVKGVRVEGFDKSAQLNNIPVPAAYTAEDIKNNVTVAVEAPTISKTNTRQELTGASYEINAPAAVPGDGTITVTSGSRRVRKTYNVRFTARNGIQPDFSGIKEDGSRLSVPVTNEFSSGSLEACALAVVKNADGAAQSTAFAEKRSIDAGGTATFEFELNRAGGSVTEVYIINDENECKLLCAPISIENGVMPYSVPSGTISECSVTASNGGETLNVNAAVTGEGTALVIIKKDDKYIDAYTVYARDGKINSSVTTGASAYGKIYVTVSYGNTVTRSFYNATQAETDSCLSDYKSLGSGDDDCINYFQKYKATINLDNYLSEELTSAEIAKAVSAADRNVSSVSEIRKNIGEGLIVELLNKTNSPQTLKIVYSTCNDLAMLNSESDCFRKYITTDGLLDTIFYNTANSDYSSIEELRNAFDENVLLTALGQVSGYGEIGDLIADSKDILAKYLDYDKLASINASGYYKYVARNKLAALSDLGKLLGDYIKSLDGNTGGSGGIGSITGSGTGKVGASAIVSKSEKDEALPSVQAEPIFTDVNAEHWAYGAISSLKSKGVINGYEDGSFGTENPVMREEFVKMLMGVFGKKAENTENKFADVDEKEWYAPYINTAADMGIVNGVETDLFGVGEEITRQDMSVLIARCLKYEGIDTSGAAADSFSDDGDISDYARDSVYALKGLGVINGMTDGSFKPNDSATRAQTARILYSVSELIQARGASFADLTGSDRYISLARKFMALDIIPSPQEENSVVTKGEFAKYLNGFLNTPDYIKNDGELIFSDVTPQSEYYGAVMALYDGGFLDKNGGVFGADNPITLGEIAAFMCRATGYDFYAGKSGGDIASYYNTALKKHIIPNSGKGIDDTVTFMEVLEIFDLASMADMVVDDINKSPMYYVSDITPLYYYHRILVLDDIVYAAGTRTADGDTDLRAGEVKIGSRSFRTGMKDAYRYLGYRVSAYYTEGEEVVKFIEPGTGNRALSVKRDMITDFDGSTLKYYKSESARTNSSEVIPKTINRLYNYNYVAEYDAADMKNADEIILIDSNGDGSYDTMNLIREAVYCITQLTPYEKTLYDYYNQPAIKLDNYEDVVVYDSDEKPVSADSISGYDILSVIEDKQRENAVIYVSREEIDGVVDRRLQNDGKLTVGIDAEEYEIADILSAQSTTEDLLSPGNSVNVLLDRHGRIAYIELDSGSNDKSNNFAYLVRALSEKYSDGAYVKVYTASGSLETLKFADNARINNNKINDGTDIEKIFKEANTDTDSVNQLVRYKLNGNGEIQSLRTAQYIDSAELYTTTSAFTRSADLYDTYYNANYRNFPGYARLSESTMIMYVPESQSLMQDEKNYAIVQFRDLKSSTFDTVELYNMSKDMVAGIAVMRMDNAGGNALSYNSVVAAVKEVSLTAVDDEERWLLTLLYSGAEQEFIMADGVTPERQYKGSEGAVTSTIEAGDLIRIATNGKGEIVDYHKIFDFDNEDDPAVVIRGNEYDDAKQYIGSSKTLIAFNDMAKNPDDDVVSGRIWQGKNPYWFTGVQYSTEFGIVKSISGSAMIVQTYPGTAGSNTLKCERYFNLKNNRVYILESGRQGVRLGSLNDIVPSDLAGEEKASRIIISRHNDVPSVAAIVIR